jgi:hypothetical protein
MRTSLPKTVLSLAVGWACFSWSMVPAMAGAPRMYQAADSCPDGQCEYVDQGPCAEPTEGCEMPCDACSCGPRWCFTAEGLALQRTSTRSQPLFTNLPLTNVPPVGVGDPLNANDLDFGVAVGPRLSATRHFDSGWDLEAVYYWIDGFSAATAVPGASLMLTDLAGTAFVVLNGEARYTSALYNGEVNLRRQWTDWLTLVVGYRMGQLNERYLGSGLEISTLLPDEVAIGTVNHFYGGQLGADIKAYDCGGPVVINTFCRAAALGNVAHQEYSRISSGFSDFPLDASRNQAAFLGEAGVVATYAITQRLALRATGEALWLTGMALAPEQISTVDLRVPRATVNTSGSVFYYGGGLGLEYRF